MYLYIQTTTMRTLVLFACIIYLFPSCQNKAIEFGEMVFPGDTTAVFPYLASDGENLFVSWIETVQDTVDILKVAKNTGGGFSSPTQVATGSDWFVNWADFPEIAVFSSGKYITHWLQKSSSSTYDYNVHVAIGEFGNKNPDTTFILHDDGINAEHGFVSFAPYQDKMMVAWLDGRKTKKADGKYGQMTLRSALLDDSGMKVWDTEIDDKVCDCCQTDLVVNGNNAAVVYRDRSDEEIRDNFLAEYRNGNWSEPQPIHQDKWKIAGCPVNGPVIESIEDGYVSAWYTEADNKPSVFLALNSNEKESPILISDDSPIGRVDLIAIGDGACVVSWVEKKGANGYLFYQVIDSEGKKREKSLISAFDPSRGSGFPRMIKMGKSVIFAYTDLIEYKGVRIKSLPLKDLYMVN